MILLKAYPDRVPWRPLVGFDPKISDAEVVTLSVMQALLGSTLNTTADAPSPAS